jgi:hypothetical protein
MAISLGTVNWRLRRQAPVSRLAAALPQRAPLWPTFSIVFLLCLPSLFTPLAVTVLNALLVVLTIAVVLATNRRIDPRLLVVIALISLVACLGFISGHGADRYDYFKDAWYIFNPVLVLLAGYILYAMKPDVGRGLRAFVVAGVLVACWQLRGYIVEPALILLPAVKIRQVIGTGSYVPVVALVILLVYMGRWRSALQLPNWLAASFLLLTTLAVAGVFSRSALVVVTIGLAALVGCFSRREWWRVGLPVVLLVLVAYVVQLYVDTNSNWALHTFVGKLARTLQELTAGDGVSVRDINLNFRAFETERALGQFGQGSVISMLFGQGFGATVDLGITMPLEVTQTGFLGVREIGTFHNGYVFLLTKVGLVGLSLYVAVLLYLYRVGRQYAGLPSSDPQATAGRLFQFAVVTLAVTTFFIGGIFNRSDMIPVLLLSGFMLAHFGRQTKT